MKRFQVIEGINGWKLREGEGINIILPTKNGMNVCHITMTSWAGNFGYLPLKVEVKGEVMPLEDDNLMSIWKDSKGKEVRIRLEAPLFDDEDDVNIIIWYDEGDIELEF